MEADFLVVFSFSNKVGFVLVFSCSNAATATWTNRVSGSISYTKKRFIHEFWDSFGGHTHTHAHTAFLGFSWEGGHWFLRNLAIIDSFVIIFGLASCWIWLRIIFTYYYFRRNTASQLFHHIKLFVKITKNYVRIIQNSFSSTKGVKFRAKIFRWKFALPLTWL